MKLYKCLNCGYVRTSDEWNKSTMRKYKMPYIDSPIEEEEENYLHVCPNCNQDCIINDDLERVKIAEPTRNEKLYEICDYCKGEKVSTYLTYAQNKKCAIEHILKEYNLDRNYLEAYEVNFWNNVAHL